MATFAAYFDDSSRDGVLSVAGYIARVEAWDNRFTPAWQRMLDAAPHPISEFKASDCRGGFGEFAGWTREERDRIMRAAVDVIANHTDHDKFLGLGTAVRLPPLDSIPNFAAMSAREKSQWRKRHADESFELCAKMILVSALTIGARVADTTDDKFELIFDRQAKQIGNTWRYFDHIREVVGHELQCEVPVPIFRDSTKVLPLQAADLLVHETARELINRGPPPTRPQSAALTRLLQARYHIADYIDTTLLLEYRRRTALGLPTSDLHPPVLYRSPDLAAKVETLRRQGLVG